MKKLANEAGLVKLAMQLGIKYAQSRGQVEFESTDSSKEKVEYLYRLLVHDGLIQPLTENQPSHPDMKHKLALWVLRHLPEDHQLKQ